MNEAEVNQSVALKKLDGLESSLSWSQGYITSKQPFFSFITSGEVDFVEYIKEEEVVKEEPVKLDLKSKTNRSSRRFLGGLSFAVLTGIALGFEIFSNIIL